MAEVLEQQMLPRQAPEEQVSMLVQLVPGGRNEDVMTRIFWLPVSATYTFPLPSTATP